MDRDKFGRLFHYINASRENYLEKEVDKELKGIVDKAEDGTLESYLEKRINLYVCGNGRTGKTWLLHYIMNKIISFGYTNIYYITSLDVMQHHLDNDLINERTGETWLSFLGSVEHLFVDNFGLEYRNDSNYVTAKMEKFLRHRFENDKYTWIASRYSIEDLKSSIKVKFNATLLDFLDNEYGVIGLNKKLPKKTIKKSEDFYM